MSEMTTIMGLFQNATDVADAIDESHRLGIPDTNIVVLTGIPYPERALGRHHEWSRLPYIVLAGALAGLLFGLFLSVVTPALYPLTVGGRAIVSGPPAAVITYVFTMMAAIVSTFLGVLWEMGFPSIAPKFYDPRVTRGYLAILVEGPQEQMQAVGAIIKSHKGEVVSQPRKMVL